MEPLLRLKEVSKRFPLKGKGSIWALKDINLELFQGETLGIVGESGCGKSTLARVIMGAIPKTQGEIFFHGAPLDLRRRRDRLAFAEKAQMVFQDPFSALNPRMRVGDIVAENLVIQGKMDFEARTHRTRSLLEAVGLSAACAQRFPNEFSGGQCQRIGIARALAPEPELLVCDEPISALDVSVQSQIMNLLRRLGEEHGLTYLFIAHDFNMVHYISQRIAVMYRGRIVELAPSVQLGEAPLHPYTQLLSQAVLGHDPAVRSTAVDLPEPEITSAPELGCAFAPRCPRAVDRCLQEVPVLRPVEGARLVACHRIPVGCHSELSTT